MIDQLLPRILFLGTGSAFSVPPLRALLRAGFPVCAVIVPADRSIPQPITALLPPPPPHIDLPILNRFVARTVVELAWEHALPVFAVRHLADPDTLGIIKGFEADVGCVACFPWRLPPALLATPPHGFVNVHPSLLPHGRGPAPVFWTLRNGDQAGVSIHIMDQSFDTGPILAQAPITLPDGISGTAADQRCAEAGGQLLIRTLPAWIRLALLPRPQPCDGSAAPWPTGADFVLDGAWSARRAFNFMRGTQEWQQPYTIDRAGRSLLLGQALAYDPDLILPQPVVIEGATVRIQFSPGVVDALPV